MINFRRFSDVEIVLSPGLNLIRGPNESGKSTIVRALIAAFFEKPSTKGISGRQDARWGSETLPKIELDFTDDDGEYRLVKNFDSKKVSLELPGEATALGSPKAADSRMAEILGFRDSSRYLRTACITQDQMVNQGKEFSASRKLAAMLREVVIGSRESALVERAMRGLSAEVDELKRGIERPTNNPGTIKRLQEEHETYLIKQKDLADSVAEEKKQRDRLAEVERLIEEKASRLADLSQLLDKNRRLMEAEARVEDLRERFEAADRAMEIAARLEGIDREVENEFPGFRGVEPAAAVELRKVIDVRESLAGLHEKELEERSAAPVAALRSRRSGVIALAAGLLLIAVSAALGSAIHAVWFTIAAPGVLLAAVGVYFLTATTRYPPDKGGKGGYVPPDKGGEGGYVPTLSTGYSEPPERARAEVHRLEIREREFLESVGCDDPETFFARFDRYRELLAERKEGSAGLSALLGQRPIDQCEDDRRRALLDTSVATENIRELDPYRLDPEKLETVGRERNELVGDIKGLETERGALFLYLEKSASDQQDSVEIEEIVTWLSQASLSAKRRLRVYTMALDAMKQASEQMFSSAIPILAASIGRTFSLLTDGRYDRVEVNCSDLAISIYSPEKEENISGDELLATLSKGTASQLYLSARLELVDLLSGGRKPPLIFDDSFSYFDERRLALLWEVLEGVAADQQVLVLTCTDRYDELASGANIIDLP